jgi:hypothetical protein
VIVALLMFPATLFRAHLDWHRSVFLDLGVFFMATISVCIFYVLSEREVQGLRGALRTIYYIPFLLSLGIGMCINNTRAVFAGLFGSMGGEFVRTPKYAIAGDEKGFRKKKYRAAWRKVVPIVEFLMGSWFIVIMVVSVRNGLYGALPFQALFAMGFFYVALLSLLQRRLARQ